jgi:hypothetical protein
LPFAVTRFPESRVPPTPVFLQNADNAGVAANTAPIAMPLKAS